MLLMNGHSRPSGLQGSTLPARWSKSVDPFVVVAGRRIATTPVFDTYWRFAAQRQRVYEARLAGLPGPWTDDPILSGHRFTNCYRAADRVSQYLISEVIYRGSQKPDEVVFRILLFKMFNKIQTWELLSDRLGVPTWADFDLRSYDEVLSIVMGAGQRLYSAAYVIPPPRLGAVRKHTNHLHLIRKMLKEGLPERLQASGSMADAFEVLKGYPSMGNFLSYQFLTDINYSTVIDFDEMEYVIAGPGALDGLRKCFGDASRGSEAELIRYMSRTQDEHFRRLGLEFSGLRGRRLQLIDCQNLFCEVDKYARVAHPEVLGYSGRSRIKQRFSAIPQSLTAWFPPKWGLNEKQRTPVEGGRSGELT